MLTLVVYTCFIVKFVHLICLEIFLHVLAPLYVTYVISYAVAYMCLLLMRSFCCCAASTVDSKFPTIYARTNR